MTSRLYICFIIMSVCMVASCSRVPKHILSERKMRVVMYDMLVAEAMVEIKNDSFPTSKDRQPVFDGVFNKHQITQAEYDSSLIWYGKHIDLYMAVYKLVLKDVNENYAALGAKKPNALSGDISSQDSIDIWVYKRLQIIRPEMVFNTFTFDIKPQNPYSSGSSYVFALSAWGIPPGLKHKPFIHLSAIQADTIVSIRQEIAGDGYHEALLRTVADKNVLQIYGYIFMNEADASYQRIYLNDIRLMKYNYGSKALEGLQERREE